MVKRRGYGLKAQALKKAKAKAKAKQKKKKGKALDWYTGDGLYGMFGGLDKSGKKGKLLFEDDDPSEIAKRNEAAMIDDDDDASSSSSSVSSTVEDDPYQNLVSSLAQSSSALERSILKKVQNEQEGIETISSSSDDSASSSEDEKDDVAEHSARPPQSDQDLEDDIDNEVTLSVSGHGIQFKERFVNHYAMNEASLEQSTHVKDPLIKTRGKTQVGNVKYSVTCVDCDKLDETKFIPTNNIDVTLKQSLYKQFEVKERLAMQWLDYASKRLKICRGRIGVEKTPKRNKFGFTELQSKLMTPLMNYADVCFTDQSLSNASEIRELYTLHTLNHVMKSVDLVAKHTQRRQLNAAKARQKHQQNIVDEKLGEIQATSEKDEDDDDEDICRDQGFTRPRVLILVPTRLAALRVVRLMVSMFPESAKIANKARFWREFAEEGADLDKEVLKRVKREELPAPQAFDEVFYDAGSHPILEEDANRHKGAVPRPADWHDTFSGNSDECFRMGIGINGRKSMHLFADFYKSDIIIASPLGLRLTTEQAMGEMSDQEDEEDEDLHQDNDDELKELGIDAKEEAKQKEKRKDNLETDFLTSIELCIIDRADILEMQNWQHVIDGMNALNRKPIEIREEMDFSRIRNYFLVDKLSRKFRQTLVFSQYPSPHVNALFMPEDTSKLNLAGLQLWRRAKFEGVLSQVNLDDITHRMVRVEQAIEMETESDDDDDYETRLSYFENEILPHLKADTAEHTLVLVPSYFDFLSVRTCLRKAAEELGEGGERARGKPWKGKSRNRIRGRDGKRISRSKSHGQVSSALFVAVSEYTEPDQVSRARGDFFHGRARIFLATERFYFYHRYKLRGIHRVVCFSPPDHAQYYLELCNLISTDKAINLMLYDERDALKLERILGTKSTKALLNSQSRISNIKLSS